METSTNKHLDLGKRDYIEQAILRGESFRSIASHIGVSPTTVSHEVKTNRHFERNRFNTSLSSKCANVQDCTISDLCGIDCVGTTARCASCKKVCCINICPDYSLRVCERLEHAPFVCQGCDSVRTCRLDRAVYRASSAQAAYERRLREARCGIDITQADLTYMVTMVRKLLRQGQSLEAIWATHGDEFPVGVRTFYNYMHQGVMGMTLMELRNTVSRRPRKKAKKEEAAPKGHFKGRTYEDWCALEEQERMNTVEMDCVQGKISDTQVILSLHFKRFCFQLYILLPDQTQQSVIAALDAVEMYCEGHFSDVFGIILTDRGHEFQDWRGIEKQGRCRVFYCDPLTPGQKGSCEKNHVELRKILPKGTIEFDALSSWDIAEVCSHVNSYPRKSLGGIAPIALASVALPQNLLESLGVRRIDPDQVVMRPRLLERED